MTRCITGQARIPWVGLSKRCSTHALPSITSDLAEVAKCYKPGRMEVFNEYVDQLFPFGAKRTRSAVIRQSYADRIVNFLKNGSNEDDKNFRHLVKKSSFQLLDLPEAGLRDVLVVKIREEKQVSDIKKLMKIKTNSMVFKLCVKSFRAGVKHLKLLQSLASLLNIIAYWPEL